MELFNKALPPVAGKPRGGQWSGMMKIDGSNGRRYGGYVMGEVHLGVVILGIDIDFTCSKCRDLFFHVHSVLKSPGFYCFCSKLFWFECNPSICLDTMVTVDSWSSNICFGSDSPEKARIYLLPQIGCTCQATFCSIFHTSKKSQDKGGRWLIPLPPFTPGDKYTQ